MGAVGGIIYLAVAAVLYPNSKTAGVGHVNYQILFIVVSAIMLVAVALLYIFIKEPKLTAENKRLEEQHPEWNLSEEDESGNETLPADVKRSLGFLLASIALWFTGYNAVTTWFTTYVSVVMGQGLGGASTCLLVATAGAIVSCVFSEGVISCTGATSVFSAPLTSGAGSTVLSEGTSAAFSSMLSSSEASVASGISGSALISSAAS